ncbi:ABC-2 family transporter protein [Posidoniimonas polymericola]|uniref:ABC-2 family transporter protein n=1 Tax=Posidoniimonas polymericola TaxID=2528002 RepID=A0A5C5YD34_9BACT|nr:ABC transporter permease subunit [Posidoniimonas polymericola]TWT72693.1 ABC-2 family transporter protein [Posidoniimonas polymericola]
MFIGPVFSREALTAPRRVRFYAVPCLFVATLLGLTLTAWQVLVGSQNVTNPGDLARFGAAAFSLLAPLQLMVCVLFSALLAAAAVAQEKDRKTLILLLLSDLTNSELVVGKLLASMLTVLMVIAAGVPFFLLLTTLGGVTYAQVARVTAVTVVASLAAGSLGSTVALWREKTFQALAVTALVIVLWLVGWEFVAGGGFNDVAPGASQWAAVASPWRAMQTAVEPAYVDAGVNRTVALFLAFGGAVVALLNVIAVVMVRVWNPSREARPSSAGAETNDDAWLTEDEAQRDARRLQSHRAPGKPRKVWDNPILWREIRTWAYGKKILVVKLGYLVIFGLAAVGAALANQDPDAAGPASGVISQSTTMLAPLFVLSIVLVNALSVTSLTNERDLKALDLLLATDLTPKELIFGKLGGVLYNAREMILLPMALCVYLWWSGSVGGENLVFLLIGLAVVNAFAAMLGLHAGMMYPNSRQAIGASIGTLLFLFFGVTTCMRMMLALSQSFEYQLAPFLGFMLGGGIALFAALAWRNPSSAMFLACFSAPFAVFYAIVSFLLGHYDWVFLATIATFGFATTAMLVPALSEFDVATGRTTARD